jgi:hypothetical protein
MKLIDEIIEILSSEKPNLINALIKTKLLLHKLDKKELIEWVNNEINGYAENMEVPPYRVVNAQVLANIVNIAYHINGHPIPLAHLNPEYGESLEIAKLRQSLGVLEEFAVGDNNRIQSPIPMDANPLLSKGLASGFKVQRAWCEISTTEITQILIKVRSTLLDFILMLSDKFGDDLSDKEVMDIGRTLDMQSMFRNAMFGDNTTILVGNHSKQFVTIQNIKNDFHSLAEVLRTHHVSELDIQELESSIDNDRPTTDNATKKEFGPSVKAWLKTMLSKAVDASWQIEIGIASNFLAEALKKYYGW